MAAKLFAALAGRVDHDEGDAFLLERGKGFAELCRRQMFDRQIIPARRGPCHQSLQRIEIDNDDALAGRNSRHGDAAGERALAGAALLRNESYSPHCDFPWRQVGESL